MGGIELLKYFIDTTGALITAALITGFVFGYANAAYPKRERIIILLGGAAGLVSGAVMAYMKNATSKIDTSMWNLRTFTVSLIALAVFFVLTLLALIFGRAAKKKEKKSVAADIMSFIAALALAVIVCLALLYALPTVLSYPYSVLLVEKSVLSTTFILKMVGILFGIILVYLAGLAVNKGSQRLGVLTAFILMSVVLLCNAVRQVTVCIRVLLTKRMIEKTDTLFEMAKFSSNNDHWFIYGGIIVAVFIPLILYIKSVNVREPYSNPAEHRKIRKKWKISRRWALLTVICLTLTVLNMTAFKAMANKVVELSPVEDAASVDDENIYVSFEQVSDGHLHRFGYVTKDNVQIRFIVIKKPNSSSYGIGLDACDICGETGYYEKDGQVVCKLCDVVMNINTIGFKGGCNPIVIPYSVENGNIIVPIEGLLEYEHEFK